LAGTCIEGIAQSVVAFKSQSETCEDGWLHIFWINLESMGDHMIRDSKERLGCCLLGCLEEWVMSFGTVKHRKTMANCAGFGLHMIWTSTDW
jgi:hypothetical protein